MKRFPAEVQRETPTPKVPRLLLASRWVERAGAARGTAAPPALCGIGVLTEGVMTGVDILKVQEMYVKG